MAEKRGPTLVEASLSLGGRPNVHVTKDGREIIRFSERDGWVTPEEFLDGQTGRPIHQITEGPWVVRELVRVDEKARRLWFTAGGREPGQDPYLRHLYSVGFDGSARSRSPPTTPITTLPCPPTASGRSIG